MVGQIDTLNVKQEKSWLIDKDAQNSLESMKIEAIFVLESDIGPPDQVPKNSQLVEGEPRIPGSLPVIILSNFEVPEAVY